jgi:hypothetical protein
MAEVKIEWALGGKHHLKDLESCPNGTHIVALQHIIRNDLLTTVFKMGQDDPLNTMTIGDLVKLTLDNTRQRVRPYNRQSGLPFNRLLALHVNRLKVDRTHQFYDGPVGIGLEEGRSIVFTRNSNDFRPVTLPAEPHQRVISPRGIGTLVLAAGTEDTQFIDALFHPATDHQLALHPVTHAVPSVAASHGTKPSYWHALRSGMPETDRFVEEPVTEEEVRDTVNWTE